MSTRCNIIIKGHRNTRFYLYHHCDGYPEYMGILLTEMTNKIPRFNTFGEPPYYRAAGLATRLIRDGLEYMHRDKVETDKTFELTDGLHSDIEYCYVINLPARTLRCYEIPYDAYGEEDSEGYYRWRPERIFKRKNLCQLTNEEGEVGIWNL